MNDGKIDTLESAIRHINTAQDVDPWAKEAAVEAMRFRIASLRTETSGSWPKTYLCDPRKNVRCPKGITCFLNGGPCQETAREEAWTDPATQAALMGYNITEDK